MLVLEYATPVLRVTLIVNPDKKHKFLFLHFFQLPTNILYIFDSQS